MDDKLKPCPFCGGESAVDCKTRNGAGLIWIYCKKCHAKSDQFFYYSEALNAWNKRNENV